MSYHDEDRLLGYAQDAINDLRKLAREEAERDEANRQDYEHALAYGGEHTHCGICGGCTPGEDDAGVVVCSAACQAEDDRVMTAFYQQKAQAMAHRPYVVTVDRFGDDLARADCQTFAEALGVAQAFAIDHPNGVVCVCNVDRVDYDTDGLTDDERDQIGEVL